MLTCAVVYLGPRVPKYVFNNLSYLKETFPELNLIFISDNVRALKKVEAFGVSTRKSPSSKELWPEFHTLTNLPANFRNEFWRLTITRFKAIEILLRELNSPVLQIEADVWLSPTFPFRTIGKLQKIGYSMTTNIHGSPSIVWFPNLAIIRSFNEFALRYVIENPNITDMLILGKYAKDLRETVTILPSTLENIYEDANEFIGIDSISIFDPGTFGMYLLGEDARNHKGFKLFNKVQESHLANPDSYNFEYRQGELILTQRGVEKKLQSLHIHSKGVSIFRNHEKEIVKRVRQIRPTPWRSFQLNVFLHQLIRAAFRRLSINE